MMTTTAADTIILTETGANATIATTAKTGIRTGTKTAIGIETTITRAADLMIGTRIGTKAEIGIVIMNVGIATPDAGTARNTEIVSSAGIATRAARSGAKSGLPARKERKRPRNRTGLSAWRRATISAGTPGPERPAIEDSRESLELPAGTDVRRIA